MLLFTTTIYRQNDLANCLSCFSAISTYLQLIHCYATHLCLMCYVTSKSKTCAKSTLILSLVVQIAPYTSARERIWKQKQFGKHIQYICYSNRINGRMSNRVATEFSGRKQLSGETTEETPDELSRDRETTETSKYQFQWISSLYLIENTS